MRQHLQHVSGYLVAILATATAALVRFDLAVVLADVAPAIPFVVPVIVAAWYGGLWPGLLATGLSALACNVLFVPPSFSFVIENVAEAVALGLFVVCGVTISGLCEALHVARRRAETELRRARCEADERGQAEERLRVTLLSIGDGLLTTDAAGRVVTLNPVAEKLTGWTNIEATGQPLEVVFSIVNEESRQPVENPARQALQEGKIVGLANHTVLIAKDGIERPIDDSAAPVRDVEGRVVGSVLVFRDITDRHEQQQQLRQSEERLRMMADAMPQIVFVIRADGSVEFINHRWHEYTGLATDDLDELPHVIHPDDLPEMLESWHDSLAAAEPWECEYRLRRAADGQYRWFLMRQVPVKDGANRVVRWYGTFIDIHERRELEEILREGDRRKDEFLATLSHELRGPLAPIHNAVQVLKLAELTDAPLQTARDMIERQVRQMVLLIDDLLDISRITLGKLDLRLGRTELASVIHHAVDTAQPYAELAGHEITVQLPTEPVYLNADSTRLAQVFGNLLTNASKYTPRAGRIRLTAVREGSDVVVTVQDNGIGIAAEHLPLLFEKFSQVAPALERSQGGLGIGLALVKGLVEMHGGTVTARSAGLGQGSKFLVRLPVLTDADVSQPAAQQRSKSVDGPTTPRRILVVDDNRDSADSLAMLLRLDGSEVQTANDGLAAVEIAARFQPDIVLLDIGMPKLNGYEACRRIRQQPGGQRIVLIAQTGWGTETDRQRTEEAGFDGHLVKPVDHAALIKLLDETKRDAS